MTCYFPNGQPGGGLFPCNKTAAVSHCCRQADICVTNGMCFSPNQNSLVRRGCTDKTFNSTECPQQCILGDDFHSTDAVLIPCDTYTTFCCGQDQAARNCCSTGNGTVHIPAGSAMLDNSSTPAIVTISTIISATTSPTICPTAVSGAASSNCHSGNGIEIGVGVALGLVTIAAATLTWFWRKAEKRVKELEGPFEQTQLQARGSKSRRTLGNDST